MNIQNGDILEDNQSITIEAFDYGVDGLLGTYDDSDLRTVSLMLNGEVIDSLKATHQPMNTPLLWEAFCLRENTP